MIKGLKTYTVQNRLIYLNSLLRSSILYGGETYYNLTERQLRMIEKMEEACLVKILDTGSKVQTALLYLETGQLPARFQIDIMMLNFLKYLLHHDKSFLISRFFWAQCLHPTKGDWVSNIKKVLIKIEYDISFEEIISIKKDAFKKNVNVKVRKAA